MKKIHHTVNRGRSARGVCRSGSSKSSTTIRRSTSRRALASRQTTPTGRAPAISDMGSSVMLELCGQNPDEPLEHRLAWEDVMWKEGNILIRPEVSKTRELRKAGLPKNLKKMLYPLRGRGPIYPGTRLDLAYSAIAVAAGVTWKHNAHRHSCLTYDMLLAPNATEVANRAGTSVITIETYYRNRHATRGQALDWFSLKPRVGWGKAT